MRWLAVIASACVLACGVARAEGDEVVLEGEGALASFRDALARQRRGLADRPLRISYLGDSLTADDQITDVLRTRLSAQLGQGGPGFAFAVSPHPYNRHRALARVAARSWKVHGVSGSAPPDRLLGLGGSAEATDGANVRFSTRTPVERLNVHYLEQPHGGTFEIVAAGRPIASVRTAGDRKRAAFTQVDVAAGVTKVELRTRGRVRLFGLSMEARRGAVVDNLGVVNATTKQHATRNLDEHFQNQLAHRAPDLVVVMLGANEAEWLAPHGDGIAEHERLVGRVLRSIRSTGAACLVVSPLDQLDWRAEGLPPRASVPAMVEAQRRAALGAGCAFWDAYAWMGGSGASRRWRASGWLTNDYQHPTTAGAMKIGTALHAALVRSRP